MTLSSIDLSLQIDLLARLALAALLGGAIGFEREMHRHPTGTRTHLLVALGAAMFATIGAFGFGGDTAPDPTRVAAQVVTGVGFLGAGAIMKSGANVRGLTTAASLWASAAVGLVVAAGAFVLAIGGTALILLSLTPLNRLLARIPAIAERRYSLRVALHDATGLTRVTTALRDNNIPVEDVQAHATSDGTEAHLTLRMPERLAIERVSTALATLPKVDIADLGPVVSDQED